MSRFAQTFLPILFLLQSSLLLKELIIILIFCLYVLWLYKAQISGEHLQDHWSSGYYMLGGNLGSLLYGDVSVMHSSAV